MLRAVFFLIFAAAAVSLPAQNQPQRMQNKGAPKLEMTGRFYFNTTLTYWMYADIFCVQNNMQLVSIETSREAREITDLAPRKDGPYWTSGSDFYREAGDFYWATNQTIYHTDKLWALGEPNDYLTTIPERYECGITFDASTELLYDEPYYHQHFFICEMPE